ncbi:putative periplasmic lipoprotein [Salinibius halmophilus]|uniref:hypothetical protein n=1 Tax=Salinibius halmophilus TaxID=1853216 RepID=UPI000E66769C|nr:hypothetical protein [Salinibius halmophilus]
MKKMIAALIASFTLAACELPPIPIPVEGETVVESNSLVVTLNALGFDQFTDFDLTSTSEFKNEVGSLSKVKAIYLDQFTLEAVSPADASIDFIHAGTFSFAADGEREQLVAEISSRPADGAKTLALRTYNETNLKNIIASEKFTLTSDLDVTSPDQDTTVNAKLVFMIHLN